jgi:microcystin-dependent protein
MSCESCYNGCVEIVSDQCVRYTGFSSLPLGIQTGDNLQTVIEDLISKLGPLLTGSGDAIALASGIRCALINSFLPPTSQPNAWTSGQVFEALTKSVCSLQTQVTAVAADIAVLNADYTIDCLTGVTASSDTHAIVQATINKLCATIVQLTALELNVDTNYVKLADLDALIAAYIASTSGGGSNQQYLKMVPYVAYEYYGPITNFDGSGIGIPANGFFKVYLCNGLNGTPDRRGRAAVGAIQLVPGAPLDAAVNPANAGNPNYALYTTSGANTVTLITSQIPAHSHSAVAVSTSAVSPNPHSHTVSWQKGQADQNEPGVYGELYDARTPYNRTTTTSTVSLTVDVSTGVTISSTGSGAAHANIQPVIAAYYIMYIP